MKLTDIRSRFSKPVERAPAPPPPPKPDMRKPLVHGAPSMSLARYNFCFTGTLSCGKRDDVVDRVIALGASIHKKVTFSTTLVVGARRGGRISKKEDDATKGGNKILREVEFLTLVREAERLR